jgi:hypothetical protein
VAALDHERCRVCGATSRRVFSKAVIGHPVDYFECDRCGYLQTETPWWLDEAYGSAINDVDTGIMMRNRLNVGRVIMTLASYGLLHGRVIDHAGGYGILVRLLRDAGVMAFWRDKYCENLLARGFEADGTASDMLTAFEVFEHLIEPLVELRAMLEEAPVVLLSTELITAPSTPAPDWWYLGPEHGQHIGFFRYRTLAHMAEATQCRLASDGQSVHLFSKRPIPRTWHRMLRAGRLWPLVARLKLRSRTMDDFNTLRGRQ